MRLLLINPNTTVSFTSAMSAALHGHLSPDVELLTFTPPSGPAAIDSAHTSLLSALSCLSALEGLSFDAYVVACFSDHPLVPLLKERLPDPKPPVIGIFEAACHTACLLGRRFAIVTTDKRWEPLLQDGLAAHGLQSRCVGVRSSGLGVLELEERPKDEVVDRLGACAQEMVQERGAEVIVLGCAGMVGLLEGVKRAVGEKVPVVDGVRAAVELASGLVRSKLQTSGIGVFATAPS